VWCDYALHPYIHTLVTTNRTIMVETPLMHCMLLYASPITQAPAPATVQPTPLQLQLPQAV
jgi:hypothetical protein